MQKIIGVRRTGDKNVYYFLPSGEHKVGDKVVVQFDDFQTVATVASVKTEVDESKAYELEHIKRVATEKDLKLFEELQAKAKENLPLIKKKSLQLGLMMKFVSAEYSLDNSKILIVFSSEERVDFRQLLKEIASMLKVRIELKQIGQRDEVKVCGGVGPCGEPCCCARFLNDFGHVTVKMAKTQGLSLSPTKINGICGRLMCCLGYESEVYEEILARMPKVGDEVISPNGKGTDSYNDILRERVSVRRQEGDTFVVEDFDLDEIVFGEKIKEYNAHPERFNLKKKEKEIKPPEDFLETKKERETKNFGEKPNQNSNNSNENRHEKFGENKSEQNKNVKFNKFDSKNKNFNKPENTRPENNKKDFKKNEKNDGDQKYGITFETAERAQAEHAAEQKRMENQPQENVQNANGTKPFKKPYNKKGRHFHFGPKK